MLTKGTRVRIQTDYHRGKVRLIAAGTEGVIVNPTKTCVMAQGFEAVYFVQESVTIPVARAVLEPIQEATV